MLLRRRPVALAVVAALACITPLLGLVPAASADEPGTTASPSAQASPSVKASTAPQVSAKPTAKKASRYGHPPQNNPTRPSTVMNYPNRGKNNQTAIRRRILNNINSTWGGHRDKYGAAREGNGTIRLTTWTFFDVGIAKALVKAYKRGVSVQVLAARTPNKGSVALGILRKSLHTRFYKKGHHELVDRWSFVRTCKSSCRGAGGTPHSKYLLFTNVGARHRPYITLSTSMNMTTFAVTNQWNEATFTWNPSVYASFLQIFKQSRVDKRVKGSIFRQYKAGAITSIFFPKVHPNSSNDPVMKMLSRVHCTGATAGGDAHHRTQIRIIQYAMYDKRGIWIAKRLRKLWNAGCNIKLIFSAMSGPPFKILHASSGRGPIPMKRSIIRNSTGFIDHYNHNKWMTISGHWGSSTKAYVVLSGSANWGNAAFKGDEQMLQIENTNRVRTHMKSFGITWRQKSSQAPHPGTIVRGKRVMAGKNIFKKGELPAKVVLGKGAFKNFEDD